MVSPRTSDPAPVRAGFTLLEVLAAVAILAIWFIVIAGAATQGLRAEGISQRRLEAGMIADRYVAELEASTVDGEAPELVNDVAQEGEFQVAVIVTPFAEGVQTGAPPNAVDGVVAADLQSMLAQEIPERVADLRRFDVRVTWTEVGLEQSVERTGFAFDLATAQEAFDEAGIPGAPAPPPAEEDLAAEEVTEP
jgi:prepilin-type N-terminal cleavage/methylation domain-containing protein